jgi:hypothetical protein
VLFPPQLHFLYGRYPVGGDVGNVIKNAAVAVTPAGVLGNIGLKVATDKMNPPEVNSPPDPGPLPTPDNSQPEMDAAAARLRSARGGQATIFRNKAKAEGGLLSSGSYQSSRLLLGS